MKQFAPDYERNEKDWIKFPRDKVDRDKLFIPESFDHPAKANLYLIEELIKYTTEPGDTIMDITAGTGTILVAAPERRVITIELNPLYAEWIFKNSIKMDISAIAFFALSTPTPVLANLAKLSTWGSGSKGGT